MSNRFNASIEAAWRRILRQAISESGMTRGQKAVTTKIVDLWMHHRNGPKGYIHPGREKLAKAAKVSVRTVATTLSELRSAGVLRVVGRPKGEGQRPTEYAISTLRLLDLCGVDRPDWAEGELAEVACKTGKELHTTLHTTGVQKLHTDKEHVRGEETQASGFRVLNGGRAHA